MKNNVVTFGCGLAAALLLLSGCPSVAPADCQTLPPGAGRVPAALRPHRPGGSGV